MRDFAAAPDGFDPDRLREVHALLSALIYVERGTGPYRIGAGEIRVQHDGRAHPPQDSLEALRNVSIDAALSQARMSDAFVDARNAAIYEQRKERGGNRRPQLSGADFWVGRNGWYWAARLLEWAGVIRKEKPRADSN